MYEKNNEIKDLYDFPRRCLSTCHLCPVAMISRAVALKNLFKVIIRLVLTLSMLSLH